MNGRIVCGIQEIILDQLMIESTHLNPVLSRLENQQDQPLEDYFLALDCAKAAPTVP